MSSQLEADVRQAFMRFQINRADPQVATLAQRVLTQMPELSSMQVLLAQHRYALGEVDEARRMMLDVVGRRDEYYAWAASGLLQLERGEDNLAEAVRWARVVRQEYLEDWHSLMDLGGLTALNGDLAAGWDMLDEAVEMAARTELDRLPAALRLRTLHLQASSAPPERFIPAAEAAIRADATNDDIAVSLIWSYLLQGRFDEAEQTALRELRLRPTDAGLLGPLEALRQLRDAAEARGETLDDVHRSGLFARIWQELRDDVDAPDE